MTDVMTIELDSALVDQLDRYAIDHSMTRSEVIREAVRWYYSQPRRKNCKIIHTRPVSVTLKVDERFADVIEKLADEVEMSKTDAIRLALWCFVKRHEPKVPTIRIEKIKLRR